MLANPFPPIVRNLAIQPGALDPLIYFRGSGPNNTSMRQHMENQYVRRNQRPGATGALGDYIQELPNRTVITKGPNVFEGPLSAPVVAVENFQTWQDWLGAILEELRRLPERMSLEWRTSFPMQPRESISFINPSLDITVAAGTAVAIVSQTIEERFTGFLTEVGVNVFGGSFADITWQLRVDGAVHPEFADRIFNQNHVQDPLAFVFELTQARTVELVAINTSLVDIDVQGILIGWTEFMSTFKSYGSSPQSGVS